MKNPIDLHRLFARASELRHTIGFAIERLLHPGLTTLRRALGRLEGDVRLWLMWIYFSAPDGTYYVAPKIAHATPPKRSNTKPPVLKLAPQHRAFVLRIANSNPWAPKKVCNDSSFKPHPTREQHLDNFAARVTALIGVLNDPDAALKRIARKLARQPLITIVTRDLVQGPAARAFTGDIKNLDSPLPEPHKRE